MPPQTRRLAAIRKNIDFVARSTYRTGSRAREYRTAKEVAAYIRAGQRLCIDAVPTEPVVDVRVRRQPKQSYWTVNAKTPQRTFRLSFYQFGEPPCKFAISVHNINAALWFERIDRRIEWRRQDIAMETLALAMHPRAGRNSAVYRASQHPLFDRRMFSILLNQVLGRTSKWRNRLE